MNQNLRHYSPAEVAERKHAILEAHRILKWLDEERWYPQPRHNRCRKTLRDEVFDLEQFAS